MTDTKAAEEGFCRAVQMSVERQRHQDELTELRGVLRDERLILAEERRKREEAEAELLKTLGECLDVAQSAKDRADDRLEPPWEVVARLKRDAAVLRRLEERAEGVMVHAAGAGRDAPFPLQLKRWIADAREATK